MKVKKTHKIVFQNRKCIRWSDGKVVTKRKAKGLLPGEFYECSECDHEIKNGEEYYEDKFHNPEEEGGYYEYNIKKICEKCWKGKRLKA